MIKLNIKEYAWKDIRDDVAKVHLDLANIIDLWNPGQEYKLYKASYSYGDLILEEGQLKLPVEKKDSVFLEHPDIPNDIKDNLSYSSFPVGIILSNTAEVYSEINKSVMSLALFKPGIPLGLLETFSPPISSCLRYVWNVSSGARSIFMLPKISDKNSHSRLKKNFYIKTNAPQCYFDHFRLFKELIKSPYFACAPWKTEVLFLSKKWFEKDYKNLKWLRFKEYLEDFFIQASTYIRNKSTFDILWHIFANELTSKYKRPNPYILDTVKHLVGIIVGGIPGHRPIYNDDSFGPFEEIKKAYMDIYRLPYAPTLMGLSSFSLDDTSRPVYCSISTPSMFESHPKQKEQDSLINEMIQTSSLFFDFSRFAQENKHNLEGNLLKQMIHDTNVEYFHSAPPENNFYSIHPSSLLFSQRKIGI